MSEAQPRTVSTKTLAEDPSLQERAHLAEGVDELRELIIESMDQLSGLASKASMVDLTSGVLHNLGNVLNTLNVTVLMVEGRLSKSRFDGLMKLTDLVQKHADSEPFLSEHPKGKLIPNYMLRLTNVLLEEESQVGEDLIKIKQNVTHMKEVIRMQQGLLKRGQRDVGDEVDLEQIIDEAVQMAGHASTGDGVEVIKHCEPNVFARSDKHKILQILVNFISNAKQACQANEDSAQKVFLRSWNEGDAWRCIEVEDTGVGVSDDDFDSLFSHGFTTKEYGHGFGLHSCKRLAGEIGGHIEVESGGPGKGARFRLFIAADLGLAGDIQQRGEAI